MSSSCLSSVALHYAFLFPLSGEEESQSLKLNSSLFMQIKYIDREIQIDMMLTFSA